MGNCASTKQPDTAERPYAQELVEYLKAFVKAETELDKEKKYVGVIEGNLAVEVVQVDITEETSDAITNAANSKLKHGSGVARAISDKGGPEIQRESQAYIKTNGQIETGTCGVTSSGELGCKHIIHSVGPRWNPN